MEHKSFPAEFKVVDEAQGIVELYASVFNNTDLGGDVIRYGAFDKSVARKKPKGVWFHEGSQTVAKTLETYPVPAGDPRLPEAIAGLGGQYVKAAFNIHPVKGTQRARDAFSDIAFGIVDEFSVGYWPTEQNILKDGTRELIELDWLEFSPVLAGMNPLTQLVSAKGKTADDLPFSDDLDIVANAIVEAQRIAARAKARDELRRKEGRMLSAANMEKLRTVTDSINECASSLSDLLASASPADDASKAITQAQLMTMQLNLRRARLALVAR